MRIISPVILFIGMSNILGTQYLLPVKKQKEYTISVIIGALLNFGANLVLIPHQLAVGAAITTIMAEALVVGVQLFFIRKDFNILEILKLAVKNIIAVVFMILGVSWLAFLNLNDYICICLQMFIGMCIYGITLLLLKDEFLKLVLEKMKGKLKIISWIYNLIWEEG